ncbi:MAG: radical SAM protein [Porphyromonadaceae bacterium]|nr:radical SAM protein [Porphyromonadaceae bacterium]
MVTNAIGEYVLELCDGKRSHSEIVNTFCELYGEEFREGADSFLLHAKESDIFVDNRVSGTPDKRTLSLVQLSISSACNLNCIYCYATARKESRYPKMTLDDYKRVIDGICKINPNVSFTLTGGEPLLNKECFAIAAYIREKNCDVDILTNGTFINEDNILQIKKLFYRVTISADGSTPELAELFRGKNQYPRITRAIQLLEKHDINYTISMVVNRKNIHDVENMARKYGGHLNYQPLFKAGSAISGDLGISGIEYYEALSKAHGVNPLSYCESSLDEAKVCKNCKCAIADGEISISETGDVYPCQLLHYPEFVAGNIHETPIEVIYREGKSLMECRKLTVDNIEGCKDCFLRYVCGGACRARAYHERGSIKVAGDFCEYEKRAFVDGIFKIYSRNLMDEA